MTELALRPGLPSDIPACAALLQGWLDAAPWMPDLHDLAETTEWMRDSLFPDTAVTVVGSEAVCAMMAVSPQGVVQQIVVAPDQRGQGLGQRLLARAKAAHPGGLSLWCFEANTAALRFYAREGFRETRRTEGENDEGLPDVLLAWGPGA